MRACVRAEDRRPRPIFLSPPSTTCDTTPRIPQMNSHSRLHLLAVPTLHLATALIAFAQPRPEDKPLPPPPPVHVEFKFDFGAGQAAEGFTHAAANENYSSDKGYGFDFGS